MNLDVSFDQSVSSLPSGFVAAVNYVVNYFDSLFANPVTINIDVGYGEIDGQTMAANALGESYAPQYLQESYSAVRVRCSRKARPAPPACPRALRSRAVCI